MPSRRDDLSFPQPPWTQAPAEVEAWLASTGGRRSDRPARPPRQPRVRGFVAPCSTMQERRLLRRLERFRFEPVEGTRESVSRVFDRLVRRAQPTTFRGNLAGARVRVRLREGAEERVRVTFTPRLTERTASKVLGHLGLDPVQGHWL